jgi:hypothetical protein
MEADARARVNPDVRSAEPLANATFVPSFVA